MMKIRARLLDVREPISSMVKEGGGVEKRKLHEMIVFRPLGEGRHLISMQLDAEDDWGKFVVGKDYDLSFETDADIAAREKACEAELQAASAKGDGEGYERARAEAVLEIQALKEEHAAALAAEEPRVRAAVAAEEAARVAAEEAARVAAEEAARVAEREADLAAEEARAQAEASQHADRAAEESDAALHDAIELDPVVHAEVVAEPTPMEEPIVIHDEPFPGEPDKG